MTDSNLFFGGMPTEPDVRKIEARYPPEEMSIGDEFLYSTIGEIIGEKVNNNRFRSVTGAWIKQMESCGFFINRTGAGKFRVLSGGEELEYRKGRTKSGARVVIKNVKKASLIDPNKLTENERTTREHFLKIGMLMRQSLEEGQKQIAAPEKTEPMPRRPLSLINTEEETQA